ncbi:methylated-DNA--[protein]-cysteine S-methyltransferase [Cohnella silvisoli]|uniref:Methylated-DNA--[protein]-cysteine S-methyltransferase n=1 Tax=Cohnella silvisoli TaxID=2873699 RepID=A0ABV1L182_9BACL|nr:methylated-DNA--[protein]-cysteine S-methyltransferase [Cohnella silvisoli]MCD9025503.1 methylated-DNA--[protein]-cysteine S-methyltransferase [Cohnella silvisoli]
MENKGANSTLYWTYLTQGNNRMVIAATSSGLSYVGSWNESDQAFADWAHKVFSNYERVQDDEKMELYVRQLEEYLAGERTSFTYPVDLQGTPFQRAVWDAMSQVPYGKTASYLEVAQSLDKPNSVRAVGTAIGRNPVLIVAPCHRIIGKNGALTGYRGGLAMKEQLLKLEKASNH